MHNRKIEGYQPEGKVEENPKPPRGGASNVGAGSSMKPRAKYSYRYSCPVCKIHIAADDLLRFCGRCGAELELGRCDTEKDIREGLKGEQAMRAAMRL